MRTNAGARSGMKVVVRLLVGTFVMHVVMRLRVGDEENLEKRKLGGASIRVSWVLADVRSGILEKKARYVSSCFEGRRRRGLRSLQRNRSAFLRSVESKCW